MTAPSGGRDVLIVYDANDVVDRVALALRARHLAGPPVRTASEALIPEEYRQEARDLLGPDAGTMRRALGDGAVAVTRETLARAVYDVFGDPLVDGPEDDNWPHYADRLLAALPGPDATGGA